MMTRGFVLALAGLCSAAIPLGAAYAQAEHAQRMAVEVATRRAQVRAALCRQQIAPDGGREALKLPTSPPVGTGGPVPLPPCPRS